MGLASPITVKAKETTPWENSRRNGAGYDADVERVYGSGRELTSVAVAIFGIE